MEREVVYLMTDPQRHLAIWSIEDLGRELDTSTQSPSSIHFTEPV
jgi:hypothetical protein